MRASEWTQCNFSRMKTHFVYVMFFFSFLRVVFFFFLSYVQKLRLENRKKENVSGLGRVSIDFFSAVWFAECFALKVQDCHSILLFKFCVLLCGECVLGIKRCTLSFHTKSKSLWLVVGLWLLAPAQFGISLLFVCFSFSFFFASNGTPGTLTLRCSCTVLT